MDRSNEKPDPALYLPFKYYFDGGDVIARDDETVATKMRGVRFYIPETDTYSGSVLYAGGTYRLEIPIYNASFVAPDDSVAIALSFRDDGDSEKTSIDNKSVTIGGWEAGKESNKTIVTFDWTVPKDMEGTKELVVEIDPDNEIDEIHEGWDPEVPGGNNFGYFPFSVVKPQSLPFTSLKSPDLAITINGMGMGDFIAYAGAQPKPFDAECVITNKGGNALISFLELKLIASNNEVVKSFTRRIGIIKSGEKRSFKFSVNPEKWKDAKELETVCYTDSEIIRLKASKSGSGTPEPGGGSGGSSGGCDAGFSALGLGVILPALTLRRRAR